MPQLNPNPWLKLFLLSWIILMVPMTALMKGTYTGTPTSSTTKKITSYWTWK